MYDAALNHSGSFLLHLCRFWLIFRITGTDFGTHAPRPMNRRKPDRDASKTARNITEVGWGENAR